MQHRARIDRRELLARGAQVGAWLVAGRALSGCEGSSGGGGPGLSDGTASGGDAGDSGVGGSASDAESASEEFAPGPDFGGLTASLEQGFELTPRVVGALPSDLRGTLYRNGPGLFARGDARKRAINDGDGFAYALSLGGGLAKLRGRFCETPKFVAEQRAGAFLYDGWTTKLTESTIPLLANQASVSFRWHANRLYALDDGQPAFELDPVTLAPLGETRLGLDGATAVLAPHGRLDPVTGEWVHYGVHYPSSTLWLMGFSPSGGVAWQVSLPMPAPAFVHDFFVSKNRIAVVLCPLRIDYTALLQEPVAFVDALRWLPKEGTTVAIFSRPATKDPILVQAPPFWMWHAINAWDDGDTMVCDFVGYDAPDHFLGTDPALFAAMENRFPAWGSPGTVRRLRVDVSRGKSSVEQLDASANVEFPFVDERENGELQTATYLAADTRGRGFSHAVRRLDYGTETSQTFDFGVDAVSGEPVFAPSVAGGPGYLLVDVTNVRTSTHGIAVLHAERVDEGPVATLELDRPMPYRLHGAFVSEK
jgi:all-trans-8'-apo-beta-carotenal 15,15'-oxygenase